MLFRTGLSRAGRSILIVNLGRPKVAPGAIPRSLPSAPATEPSSRAAPCNRTTQTQSGKRVRRFQRAVRFYSCCFGRPGRIGRGVSAASSAAFDFFVLPNSPCGSRMGGLPKIRPGRSHLGWGGAPPCPPSAGALADPSPPAAPRGRTTHIMVTKWQISLTAFSSYGCLSAPFYRTRLKYARHRNTLVGRMVMMVIMFCVSLTEVAPHREIGLHPRTGLIQRD